MRCHALGLLGRSHRARDLDAARAAFEEALACAELANLPLWRLRALHELGTIELFEQAGVDRLGQARRTAADLGALSTAAVLDIQLAAAYLFRFDPDAGQRHAASALAAAERLRLTQLRATALVFLAELAGLRRDGEAMERHNSLALAAAPGDREIEGSVWGGRGIAALLDGDEAGARRALQRAVECLAPLPNSGPGIYLGLWPLLLAVHADPHAADAIASARRTGMTVNRANRGMLLYAEAVLAGRRNLAATRPLSSPTGEPPSSRISRCGPTWPGCSRPGPRWPTAGANRGAGSHRPPSRSAESGVEPLVQRCHAMLAEPAPDAPGVARGHAAGDRGPRPGISRVVRTGTSPRGFTFRTGRLKSTSRACCARPGPGPGPSWPRCEPARSGPAAADYVARIRGLTDVPHRASAHDGR